MGPEPRIHHPQLNVLAIRLTIHLYFVSPTQGKINMFNREANLKHFDDSYLNHNAEKHWLLTEYHHFGSASALFNLFCKNGKAVAQAA